MTDFPTNRASCTSTLDGSDAKDAIRQITDMDVLRRDIEPVLDIFDEQIARAEQFSRDLRASGEEILEFVRASEARALRAIEKHGVPQTAKYQFEDTVCVALPGVTDNAWWHCRRFPRQHEFDTPNTGARYDQFLAETADFENQIMASRGASTALRAIFAEVFDADHVCDDVAAYMDLLSCMEMKPAGGLAAKIGCAEILKLFCKARHDRQEQPPPIAAPAAPAAPTTATETLLRILRLIPEAINDLLNSAQWANMDRISVLMFVQYSILGNRKGFDKLYCPYGDPRRWGGRKDMHRLCPVISTLKPQCWLRDTPTRATVDWIKNHTLVLQHVVLDQLETQKEKEDLLRSRLALTTLRAQQRPTLRHRILQALRHFLFQ